MDAAMARSFREVHGHDAYAYQLRLADSLLSGDNVVLRAPTGSGKTKAALFPFLYARLHGISFADRLIFAFPMRTLAQAQFEEVRGICAKVDPSLSITIQTGSNRGDQYFGGDVIFTTIDQLLSAYIGAPVSLPGKLANIPAGALLGAYVVFDEVHLLEPARALSTAVELASRLRNHTRILLMTATLSQKSVDLLAKRIGAQAIEVDEQELLRIPNQQGKQRRFVWHGQPLTTDAIVAEHQDRSIVVVNSVQRAQDLAFELRSRKIVGDPDIAVLHSRFLTDDRRNIESSLIERLGEQGTGNLIAVATQVIEVGLNISSNVLHTEVAPASAVVQRAGRCVRFVQPKEGAVHVYELETNELGVRRYGPYTEDRDLVDATALAFERQSGSAFDYAQEQALVDAVHADRDSELLMAVSPIKRADAVRVAQQSGAAQCVRDLIRNIDSVSLIVHDNPSVATYGARHEAFSLPRTSVQGFISDLDRLGQLDALSTMSLEASTDQVNLPTWRPVRDVKEARGAHWLCIRPSHAEYTASLGLKFCADGTAPRDYSSPSAASSNAWQAYSYRKELYAEHIERVVQAFDANIARSSRGAQGLERSLALRDGGVTELARLVCRLHDVGKLSREWQNGVWNWQMDHGGIRDGFLAHTDYDGSMPGERAAMQSGEKSGRYRRPPHAPESAFAVIRVLNERVQTVCNGAPDTMSVLKAAFSAIVRHHGATTEELHSFELEPGAADEVARTLRAPSLKLDDCPTQVQMVNFKKRLSAPRADNDEFLLYWFIARQLRLADQEGTATGSVAT